MNPLATNGMALPYYRAVANDVDGLLSTTATSASPDQVAPGDYDGVEKTLASTRRRVPRTLTVTLGAAVGSYTAAVDWTFTGTYGGQPVVATAAPTGADGSETLVPAVDGVTQPFDDPAAVTIDIPAQQDTSGSFTVGVGDICAPLGDHLRGVRADADGTVELQGDDGKTEILPVLEGELLQVVFTRVVAGAGTTAGVMVGQ